MSLATAPAQPSQPASLDGAQNQKNGSGQQTKRNKDIQSFQLAPIIKRLRIPIARKNRLALPTTGKTPGCHRRCLRIGRLVVKFGEGLSAVLVEEEVVGAGRGCVVTVVGAGGAEVEGTVAGGADAADGAVVEDWLRSGEDAWEEGGDG